MTNNDAANNGTTNNSTANDGIGSNGTTNDGTNNSVGNDLRDAADDMGDAMGDAMDNARNALEGNTVNNDRARSADTTSFQRMLDNARVHDRDGVLTDGENSAW